MQKDFLRLHTDGVAILRRWGHMDTVIVAGVGVAGKSVVGRKSLMTSSLMSFIKGKVNGLTLELH